MKANLPLEELAQLLRGPAVGVCALAFIASAPIALYSTLLVIWRTGARGDPPEERALSWSERQGRKNSRFGRFFVTDEFRSLRRLYFSAWAVAVASFGLLALLVRGAGHQPARSHHLYLYEEGRSTILAGREKRDPTGGGQPQ
jgi:hypothetical protein